jgi:hypothetical protein
MRTEVTLFEKQCDFFRHLNKSQVGELYFALILTPAKGIFMAFRYSFINGAGEQIKDRFPFQHLGGVLVQKE